MLSGSEASLQFKIRALPKFFLRVAWDHLPFLRMTGNWSAASFKGGRMRKYPPAKLEALRLEAPQRV